MSVPSRRAECRLRTLDDVRPARETVRDAVRAWGLGELADDVMQAAHEMAVNAVTHGRSDCTVAVSADDDSVRVEATDSNDRQPVVALGPLEALSGRGLPMVAALADDWGVDTLDDGKVVWACFYVKSRP